jgi:ATP-binding cassette subfamily F protein 3
MVRKGKEAALAVEEHPGGGHITVTAQQSRYALDAVDAPASKEVGRGNSNQTELWANALRSW